MFCWAISYVYILQIPISIIEKGSGFFLLFGILLLLIVFFKKVFGGSDVLVDGAVRSLNITGLHFNQLS